MSPAAELVELLRSRGDTLAVAESFTGGLVVAELIGVPGASAVIRGGIVAYATDLKSDILGVDAGLVAAVGAVDAKVAAQMAAGVRERLGATWGLATTGVAGPDPQDGRPVGTCFVAVAGRISTVVSPQLTGDRATIRVAGVRAALAAMRLALDAPVA